jgi:hypothetical protein
MESLGPIRTGRTNGVHFPAGAWLVFPPSRLCDPLCLLSGGYSGRNFKLTIAAS